MSMASGGLVIGLRGTYIIETRHGEGAFGITYRARETTTGATVILKELRLEKLDDWKALELFEREGHVLSSLAHPNIPAFYDFFAHGGPTPLPVEAMRSYAGSETLSLVLVQQFIEGTTLQQRLESAQRLTVREADTILRALLGALRYLHERTPSLVHRDVKPGNVILTSTGKPYLVDFGAIQDRLRSAGSVGSTIVGTLGYMPLEQIRGDARPASDLYALGATLIVALTGRPLSELPFDDATGKLAVSSVLPPETPDALRDVLDGMVAPLLGQRIPSARVALSRLDASSRVRARPPAAPVGYPPPSGAGDGATSRRPASTVAVAGVILLMAAVAVFFGMRASSRPPGVAGPGSSSPEADNAGAEGPGAATWLTVGGSQPGVALSVDGRDAGGLPARVENLSPGPHSLRVAGEGYQPLEKTVTLRAGGGLDLGTIELLATKPRKAKVTIERVRPFRAHVFLVSASVAGRRELPSVPITLELDTTNPWTIAATSPGYEDYSAPINFDDGKAPRPFVISMKILSSPENGSNGCLPKKTVEAIVRQNNAKLAACGKEFSGMNMRDTVIDEHGQALLSNDDDPNSCFAKAVSSLRFPKAKVPTTFMLSIQSNFGASFSVAVVY